MQTVKKLLTILLTSISLHLSAQQATYIANSGVMIQVGSSKVIIDALFEDNRGKFLTPSSSDLFKIMGGQAPFNNVNLYLITHADKDHIANDIGTSLFSNQKSAKLVTTAQVVDSLKLGGLAEELIGKQVISYPYSRAWKFYDGGDIKLKSAYSTHSGKKHAKIQNMIFYMLIGGKRVLHLGDADMDLERFQSLKLHNEKFDIAFVPFWYMTSHYGSELIEKYIDAEKIVAVHLPEGSGSKYNAKIKEFVPNAVIFHNAGQTVSF